MSFEKSVIFKKLLLMLVVIFPNPFVKILCFFCLFSAYYAWSSFRGISSSNFKENVTLCSYLDCTRCLKRYKKVSLNFSFHFLIDFLFFWPILYRSNGRILHTSMGEKNLCVSQAAFVLARCFFKPSLIYRSSFFKFFRLSGFLGLERKRCEAQLRLCVKQIQPL